MPSLKNGLVLALAGLSLAACNDGAGRGAVGGGSARGICAAFPGQSSGGNAGAAAPAAPMDAAGAVDDCLHRWGYALAASPDPAEQVARATVAACTTALARWNQQAMTPVGPGGSMPSQAPSLVTGEDTTPVGERYAYAQSRALFYVVQGRAGKCAAPPMEQPAAAERRTY